MVVRVMKAQGAPYPRRRSGGSMLQKSASSERRENRTMADMISPAPTGMEMVEVAR
jgi:hypothetical protein